MTSVLNVDTIADKAGTGPVGLTKQSAAKAWVNFDGSSGDGSTISARDSFSVSSITDNGTSDYTTTFVSAMSNDDFAVSAQSTSTGAGYICNAPKNAASGSISTTIIRSIGIDFNGNTNDHEFVHHIIHGDLA